MSHEKGNSKDLERAVMFNDAVFAIVLTLLVLELRLPDHAETETPVGMLHALQEMLPHFLAFLLSAVLVGGNWISVFNLQRTLIRIDNFFVADLVLYLIIISLIPFCCYLVGNYPENPISFVAFGGVCQALVVNSFFFIRHCRKKNLFHPDADLPEIKRLEMALWIIFVLLGGMMWIAFYNTHLSLILFLSYNLIPFFVTQRLKIKTPKQGDGYF
ncbi:MAG: TMEM175 family protein [Chitinophagales bacterium]